MVMRSSQMRTSTVVLATTLIVAIAGLAFGAPLPGGTLDPLTIPKFADPLPILGVMPQTTPPAPGGVDHYTIAVRQFQQQVLSTKLPPTRVWGYGAVNAPATFHYPAFSIEARVDRPVRVKWVNDLRDARGNFLSHLLSIDQTLHWANPRGDCLPGTSGPLSTDCEGRSQLPYRGPVPIVVHVHGAHVGPASDGFPEAWFLPAASNINCIAPPAQPSAGNDVFCRGSHFGQILDAPIEKGAAVFEYPNKQRATTLWFHDHSIGTTRTNVYAGLAGFYLLRGGAADLPAGVPGGLPGGAYEIPLVIQDRSFNKDGSLFYPKSRTFYDAFTGPYIGDRIAPSDVSPIHNPEFFGNTIVVNGKTWPFLNIEPRKYRFRILNGSDSRFFILKFPDNVRKNFVVIGTDGGFLPSPAVVSELLVGPAERFDVIVDFSGLRAGVTFNMMNVGPDSRFDLNFHASGQADVNTTGQVMQFRVVALTAPDSSAIPPLPIFTRVGAATNVRQVSLNERASSMICVDKTNRFVSGRPCINRSVPLAPIEAQLGTIDSVTGSSVPLNWDAPSAENPAAIITENPTLGSTEEWEISNLTSDAHTIHIHQVKFQVINRQPIGGVVRGPEVWETGYKDTVVSYPGEITRIRAVYDIPGLFVWHSSVLSRADNEMMRPFCVGDIANCRR
jgi:spore coat protein A, manganese oxidase